MRKNHRGGRTAGEIRRIISELLTRGELKDPRLSGFVSITDAKASVDGSYATVYVTVFGSGEGGEATEEEKAEVLAAFDRAKGKIRHEVGARLSMRHTPELRFEFDEAEAYGRKIEGILDGLGVTREKHMNTPEQLAEVLEDADTVRIFTHENMDADTLGSAVALTLALNELGIDCVTVSEEKIPDNIAFIEYGCTTNVIENDLIPDVTILMDVGDTTRIGEAKAVFEAGRKKMLIDHHISSKPIYDYNIIDTEAAATAELVYEIIKALAPDLVTPGSSFVIPGSDPESLTDASQGGATTTQKIAEALYTAIVTDTGCFRHPNTTPQCHRTAAELIEAGADVERVTKEVYQNIRPEKLMLETAVMETMKLISGGRAVCAVMTREMLKNAGALDEETEGIAEKLRNIKGVEVSVFLRQTPEGRVKASMRSGSDYDVQKLSAKFGGGGHMRAAGFTTDEPIEEIEEKLVRALEQTL
jgi:phosphoesterase RecJ-like protein